MSSLILSKLNISKEFLMYLDTQGILNLLQETVFKYKRVISCLTKEEFIPPFRFLLQLDVIKIQEISEERLYNMFMKEPAVGLELAKSIIFHGLKILLPNVNLDLSDLQIVPYNINLPPTTDIVDLLLYPTHGLESVEGILIAQTSVTKYKRSSVYSCKLSSCPNNERKRYPENCNNICPHCLGVMEEDISSGDTGEEIISLFISKKAYQSLGRFQAVKVRIKDELCSSCEFELGEEYVISGRLCESFFEAMNLQLKVPNPEFFVNFRLLPLPESITNFYEKISNELPNCPWSFVVGLSSLLAFNHVPTSSFLHLKIGLMLSLSSQQEEEPPVSLIAVGTDSLNAQYLFQSAGRLAKRYIKHSVTHSYLGGVAKSGLQSDVIWEEAGQLILAAKGVCNLGDWSKFKKEQANYICQTIESGQIILNKGELGKKNLINIVPLKTSVWTYWSHITPSRNDQLQLKTLINVFGIPFLAQERNETEEKKICWKYFTKTKNTSNTEPIPLKDLKEFIENINSRKPLLTEAASKVIRNYFVVSRRERPQCLPIRAIKTITALAEAHARLGLRNEVEYEDVVAVLYLYEESLSVMFGPTMNCYKKLNWDNEEPIHVFLSRQINEFRLWLEDYIEV